MGAHLEARDGFESLNRWLHAAQSASLGGDHEGSIRFLQTWLKQKGANYSRYYRALAYIQVGDVCKKKGDADKGNRAFLEASQLLEEQADLEERRGQRRAAFECYQALESMGILADSHEALIEGGLNCIRLLKEMNQRFNTMRHYHDLFIILAKWVPGGLPRRFIRRPAPMPNRYHLCMPIGFGMKLAWPGNRWPISNSLSIAQWNWLKTP